MANSSKYIKSLFQYDALKSQIDMHVSEYSYPASLILI